MLHRTPLPSSVACSEPLLGFWLDTGLGIENPKTQPATPGPPRSTPAVPGLIRQPYVGTHVGTHLGEPSDTSEPRPAKGEP
jgi:hypothetical protein